VAEAIAVHTIFEGAMTPTEIHDCVRRAQMQSRSVDLYVLPKPFHIFGKSVATHGSPYDYDRRVPLFLCGPGFKAGYRSLDEAAPGSGVVTIAEVLGIVGPAAADHPLLGSAIAE
jgi:predicted AlkP superfamily pyrophosphatase or phosphodiesterase